MLASKPGLGDLAQSMRLVEGVHEGQGKDDHQHHYDQGVDLKKALHTWLKKKLNSKKNTNNNWIAALQISHTVFPQVEEKHVVDLKTTGARGWGPAAPISKKKTE